MTVDLPTENLLQQSGSFFVHRPSSLDSSSQLILDSSVPSTTISFDDDSPEYCISPSSLVVKTTGFNVTEKIEWRKRTRNSYTDIEDESKNVKNNTIIVEEESQEKKKNSKRVSNRRGNSKKIKSTIENYEEEIEEEKQIIINEINKKMLKIANSTVSNSQENNNKKIKRNCKNKSTHESHTRKCIVSPVSTASSSSIFVTSSAYSSENEKEQILRKARKYMEENNSKNVNLKKRNSKQNSKNARKKDDGDECDDDHADEKSNDDDEKDNDVDQINELALSTNRICCGPPVLQNIIASAHLLCEINLRELSISTRNAEYNPKRLNAVILRLQKPKCTALVFRTGRILITGSRTEENALLGGRKIAKVIKKCSPTYHSDVKFKSFKIENLIATADCCVPVRLEGLANDHKEFCSYEPELFAGLVYRYNPSEKLKAVLLIFVSGKIIITGCKTYKDIMHVWQNIYPVVMQYHK